MLQRVCDQCKRPIQEKQGYLRITIIGPGGEYEDEETKDFCGSGCLNNWIHEHVEEVADRIRPKVGPGLELAAAPAT